MSCSNNPVFFFFLLRWTTDISHFFQRYVSPPDVCHLLGGGGKQNKKQSRAHLSAFLAENDECWRRNTDECRDQMILNITDLKSDRTFSVCNRAAAFVLHSWLRSCRHSCKLRKSQISANRQTAVLIVYQLLPPVSAPPHHCGASQ